MKKTIRQMRLALTALLLLAWAPNAMCGGKLDAFEADANAHHAHADHAGYSGGGHDDGELGDMLIELTGYVILAGGVCSWERASGEILPGNETNALPRLLGEPLIPFVRYDFSYQDVRHDINAVDMRAEAGYGPFGVHYDNTHYNEHDPKDTLDLTRILGLYRMSFGSYVETDLGFGSLIMNGDQNNSRFLFSTPILIHPSKYWGIEFRPAWADRMRDNDLAAMLTWRYASLKLGYRWVSSPSVSLAGPYVGLSVRL